MTLNFHDPRAEVKEFIFITELDFDLNGITMGESRVKNLECCCCLALINHKTAFVQYSSTQCV